MDITITHKISSTRYRGKYQDADVAIKMLRRVGAMHNCMREIEILSHLRHPRIVSLLGVILDLEDRYEAMAGLVTEFMPRGSLYDVLHLDTTPFEHRLITLSSKLRVLRDVADGMSYLHMCKVIHRDLKSPNVLLDEDGRAKICDFGMSKLLSTNATHATAGGAGTPAWQAPESFRRGGEVRFSSDVYSFGVIVWEVMTGEIPWAEYDATQIMTALLVDKLTLPLPEASVNCPGRIVELMIACFGDAENRPDFPSAMTLLERRLATSQRNQTERIPEEFLCPISFDIMEDPVVCSDGHSYERGAIEDWLQHHDTSPKTNMRLPNKNLIPNIALRGIIRNFAQARK